MICFEINTFQTVSVVLCMSLICVESQDFCRSYEQNKYSVIVFSQSEDTIMLIVGKHFWRLRENDTELVFDRQDFEASNASEQWTENTYDFAHPVYVMGDINYRGIVLFKDLNKPKEGNRSEIYRLFDYNFYRIYGNYFKHLKSETNYMEVSSGTQFVNYAFTIIVYDQMWNVEIVQHQESNTKSIESQYRQVLSNYSLKLIRGVNDGLISPLIEKLSDLKTNISVFGIYFNSNKEFILFFRREYDINYCGVDQCLKEEYKTLISCPKPQSAVNYWLPVTIFVISVVVIVIIVVIVIYWLEIFKGQTDTTGSAKTVDSDTTLDSSLKPKTPPKVKPVPKKVKKESPVKQQKPITPLKGKSKKSPKA